MKMNTKSKLISSLLVLVLCVTAFAGSTYAWFTDSVTSAGNRIEAGKLDVDLLMYTENGYESISNDTGDIFTEANGFITLWEPGKTQIVYLGVKNAGTLALKYNILLNVIDNGLVGSLEYAIVPGAVGGVDSFSNWEAVKAVAQTGMIAAGKTTAAEGGCLDEILKGTENETEYFALAVHMKEEAGNEYQGKDATIDIILQATQKNAESDAFGPDYDVDATYDIAVSTAEDLAAALKMGGKIGLEADITVDKGLEIPTGVTATLNLNGKALTGTGIRDEEGNRIHTLTNNGTLTLVNGTVASTGTNGGSAILNKGVLTLNEVAVNGAPSNTADGYASYAVNTEGVGSELTVINSDITGRGAIGATEGTKVVVNGGTYRTPEVAWGHAIYADGEGTEVTINDGTFSEDYAYSANNWGMYQIYSANNAKVVVNGGTFKEWDCANGYDLCTANGGTIVVYGGTFAENPASQNGKNYVASGYEVTQGTNGTWTVGLKKYENSEDLKDAVASATAGETIGVKAGTYTFPTTVAAGVTIECEPGTVFEGTSGANINGATVVGATFSNENGVAVSGTINATFKDCTFEGSEALRWCYSAAGETVVFENCVIKTDFRGFHFDDMKGEVVFRNCKINGFNAYGGEGTMTFEGCTFGNDESRYNGLNIYSNTVIKDCTFNFVSGKTNFIDMEEIGKELTITNCTATLDGASANVEDFVGGSKLSSCTFTLDGVTVTK